MKANATWLSAIHCFNNNFELAVKDMLIKQLHIIYTGMLTPLKVLRLGFQK